MMKVLFVFALIFAALAIAADVALHVWDCDSGPLQQWVFEHNRIKMRSTTSQCIAVGDFDPFRGATIWLQDCAILFDANELWEYDNSTKQIKSSFFHHCMRLSSRAGDDGTGIEAWDCSNDTREQWIVDTDRFTIQSVLDQRCLDAGSLANCQQPELAAYPYCNPALSADERAVDLVARLTMDEKMSQLIHESAAILRLGVPFYDWWSECLHGVLSPCGSRCPSVFPEPIATSASFNASLFGALADAISTEARALNNENPDLTGLTYWTPNINIFRDPRWGRGQETPGEDPYLTSVYAIQFIRGLQGNNPHYTKVVGTCKHYAAYDLENWHGITRHTFNAIVSDHDLTDTFLPAFDACARLAEAQSVMCSYNEVNGVPSCASSYLQQNVLREQFNWTGYIVSDCDAVADIQLSHHYTNDSAQTCGVAMKAGTDLDCGNFYQAMPSAVKAGTVSEAQIDIAVQRLFVARFRLGMFDPPEMVPFKQITMDSVDSWQHKDLALDAARQGIVLLNNSAGLLPLSKSATVAVIGPNANATDDLLGNYHGSYPFVISPLQGIINKGVKVIYEEGCQMDTDDISKIPAAVKASQDADVTVLVLGLDQSQESEGNDRTSLQLPGVQMQLVAAIAQLNKPTVVVLITGGPVAVDWIRYNMDTVLLAWYGGEMAGYALSDVLFGDYNPAGRLPITYYPAAFVEQIPMTDMDMRTSPGHTYRYYTGQPLWEFGHGLSYTTFSTQWAVQPITSGSTADTVMFHVNVTNTGTLAGDEVVLAFVSVSTAGAPLKQLFGFTRVHLQPGEATTAEFTLTPGLRSVVNEQGQRYSLPVVHTIRIGQLSAVIAFSGEPFAVASLM
eukprot:TRINITY_DN957_c0_g1_i2.p1 TRINITY_DN957_c0_g1~~TRINITY_DN957_c0_g1_i2.p1  ORF type:complete len:847 (-),score=150.04 TRINITY_DN957_c0_g1_i2:90-2630(-)